MTKEQQAAVDAIKALLLRNDHAVERAVLAIHARQTEGERSAGVTVESNGRGFTAFDAPAGKYYADWLNKRPGNRLTGNFLVKARRMMLKYAGQLAIIAAHNRANKVEAA